MDAWKERAREGSFRVQVRPGAATTRIAGWDADRCVLLVDVAAKALEGKANGVLVKFLSRELGFPVRIRSGLSSREKKLEKK
ncbi:MAG: DUF167 domain-containing protein [Nitrosarchaeum sp.]|nr:DUF167 domain-containing protein [Nitrosarchaeum sp.]